MDKKILVGSPVRQKHQILEQFLLGLEEVDKTGFTLAYYFVDDNVDEESSKLLEQFAQKHDVLIKKGSELTDLDSFSKYVSDEITHLWDPTTIRKVAYFKDSIIEYAVENNFDYLFFVDSDIVVDKRTIQQLASRNVDIVSNVFWTQWQPNWELEPQCFWMPALNVQSVKPFAPPISREESRQLQRNFFAKMRIPGMYKVDGLGACTLISWNALAKGVRFKEIPNLALLGEDRHFCIRAGALGFTLYFDTVHPVYHIYREEYLNRVDEFKREGFKYDMCQTYLPEPSCTQTRVQRLGREIRKVAQYIDRKTFAKIRARKAPKLQFVKEQTDNTVVLIIVVRDESVKSLRDALLSVKSGVDFVLFADATSDGLDVRICEGILDFDKYEIVRADSVGALWHRASEYGARWVLAMEADEVLQSGGAESIRHLVNNVSIDAYFFRRYDMWNEDKYRDDAAWHPGYVPYLMRYQKEYPFEWTGKWNLPVEAERVPHANMNIKMRCVRWATTEDRNKMYEMSQNPALLDESPIVKPYSVLSDEI